ncbi:hypothetical protein PRIPAC_90440 [Pristionchus pacificus]|uniref:Uncharacterized protein n=1 Tax=Pristionchus pacificus TaxID=54126 RepID=A0A2A6B8B8_PRIPA|nr:hypothetical protein PRIPAC_90440 [Pristionchus pacificus]|eukprot:PDM62116.1 hypothetical protein PRIPAC_51558 [Pristionchus pacificus]
MMLADADSLSFQSQKYIYKNISKLQGDVYNLAQPRDIPAVNFVPDKGGDHFYFRYHHSPADYVSVFEEGDLEYTAAVFASMANVIANQDHWW